MHGCYVAFYMFVQEIYTSLHGVASVTTQCKGIQGSSTLGVSPIPVKEGILFDMQSHRFELDSAGVHVYFSATYGSLELCVLRHRRFTAFFAEACFSFEG